MTTLTDFLLARIADDEENAGRFVDILPEDTMTPLFRRVLAECEAKRRIVSRCDLVLRGREHGMFNEGQATDANDNLRSLAAVYAGHADYQAEWASA